MEYFSATEDSLTVIESTVNSSHRSVQRAHCRVCVPRFEGVRPGEISSKPPNSVRIVHQTFLPYAAPDRQASTYP